MSGKNLNTALAILTWLAVTSCGRYINNGGGQQIFFPSSEFGKCYVECGAPPRFGTNNFVLPVYKGTSAAGETCILDTVSFVLDPACTYWVKRRAANCPPGSNDCMVYCKKIDDATVMDVVKVRDTFACKSFELKAYDNKVLFELTDKRVWKNVICESKMTRELLDKVYEKLVVFGYFVENQMPGYSGEYDFEMQKALVRFQSDHNLEMGGLTPETLIKLDVKH